MTSKTSRTTLVSQLLLGLFLLVTVASSPVFAIKGYRPPDALYKEIPPAQAAVMASPNSADAHFELAMVYAYTGYIEEGWEELKRVNELNANYAAIAVPKYEALTKSDPTNWKYKFKLAFGYYFQDQKEKGQTQFQLILDQDPNNIWAMGFLAFLKGESGDIPTAISLTKKALTIEPHAPALHFLLGTAYIKKGDYLAGGGEMMSYLSNRTRQRRLPEMKHPKALAVPTKSAQSAN